jgi:hypothetical protein
MLIMFAFNHCLLNNLYIYTYTVLLLHFHHPQLRNNIYAYLGNYFYTPTISPSSNHVKSILYIYIYKPTLSRCGSTPRTRMIRLVEPPAQHDDITPTPRLREMKTGLEGWDIKLGLHRQVCELNIP